MSEKEEYLGTSHSINLVNSDKQSVGTIKLEEGGGVSITGSWANEGNVSYNTVGKKSGFGLIVDAKLADNAKIYGVDKFSQDNYNTYNYPNMEFDFNAKDFVQEDFREKFTAPESGVSKVINGVGGATSGSGIAPYCSECPPATAGPAPIGAVDGPSNKSAYDGYRMGVALNHLLWHNKKSDNKDNNEKKK